MDLPIMPIGTWLERNWPRRLRRHARVSGESCDQEEEHAGEIADRIIELGGLPIVHLSELEKNANFPYPKPPKGTSDYKRYY